MGFDGYFISARVNEKDTIDSWINDDFVNFGGFLTDKMPSHKGMEIEYAYTEPLTRTSSKIHFNLKVSAALNDTAEEITSKLQEDSGKFSGFSGSGEGSGVILENGTFPNLTIGEQRILYSKINIRYKNETDLLESLEELRSILDVENIEVFDHNYEDWSELLNIYYDLNMDSCEYVHGGGSGQGSGEGSGSMRIGSYRTAERSTKEVKLRIRAKQNNHQSAAELLNVVKKSASNGDEFGEIAELCDTQIYVLPPWSTLEPTTPEIIDVTTPLDVTTKFDVTTETQIKTVG